MVSPSPSLSHAAQRPISLEIGYLRLDSGETLAQTLTCTAHSPRAFPFTIGKRYRGDYHPGEGYSEISRKTNPELWESIPRACGSCGEIKHCLKPNSAQYFLINYARY